MQITKNYEKKLKKELDFIVSKMEVCSDVDTAMYYFSGIHAITHRIFNMEYSDDLLFIHFVLEKTYQNVTGQKVTNRQGNPIGTFHKDFLSKLKEYTIELKDGFFNEKKRNEALKKIVVLGYSCTGNGRFLAEKGDIDIFPPVTMEKEIESSLDNN